MIREIKTEYRFSNVMIATYLAYVKTAFEADQTPVVFADVGSRCELKTLFQENLSKEQFERIEFRTYPHDPRVAENMAKGLSNAMFIVVDENGRFTDQISRSIGWSMAAAKTDALIVHH